MNDDFTEKAAHCALNRIFGFEPKVSTALISATGSAKEVFRIGKDALDSILGPFSRHKEEIIPEAVEKAAEELEQLKKLDISFVGWNEPHYPPLLKECEDAPAGLYVRSLTPPEILWSDRTSISVVGTRDISHYGKEWCERIVMGLSATSERPAIVSGLAIGTDICAHRTALYAGLPTIGVMATGPENIYPWRHAGFAEMMYKEHCCALVTDYPPGTVPMPVNFLRRNRIIAGLSEATVLVESKIKGGGMMTARLAFSYNREVYALPGRADDLRSQGCNELIRAKIAEPVTSAESLTESLRMHGKTEKIKDGEAEAVRRMYGNTMSEDRVSQMTELILAIKAERGIVMEDLAAATGLGFSRTAHLAGILESDGLISIDLLQRCSINTKKL